MKQELQSFYQFSFGEIRVKFEGGVDPLSFIKSKTSLLFLFFGGFTYITSKLHHLHTLIFFFLHKITLR